MVNLFVLFWPGKAAEPKAAKKPKEEAKPKGQKQDKKAGGQQQAAAADASAAQKQTRLGMEAKKEESLADWYSQVITKAEMLEYYDVSGCYILRPWAYSIWERIQVIRSSKEVIEGAAAEWSKVLLLRGKINKNLKISGLPPGLGNLKKLRLVTL